MRQKPEVRRSAQLDHSNPARVRDEIALLERRLSEIGHDGDCAYEKAMIRFFQQEVGMRREWLSARRFSVA